MDNRTNDGERDKNYIFEESVEYLKVNVKTPNRSTRNKILNHTIELEDSCFGFFMGVHGHKQSRYTVYKRTDPIHSGS